MSTHRRDTSIRIIALSALAGMTSATAPAHAASDEPISAERPGFSSSPEPLGVGLFQVEGGYQYLSDDEGADVDAHSVPLLLLRAGLARRTSLQLAWTGYTRAEVANETLRGVSDLSIGLKHKLVDQHERTPAVAVFGAASLPAGDDEFSSDAVDPSLGLFWSYAPRSGPGVFGTVLASSVTAAGERTTQLTNAAGLAFSHTGQLGSYVEYFGTFVDTGGPAHNLNGGVTFLVNNDLQLDLHAGAGLNERAPDFFLGLGFARRW